MEEFEDIDDEEFVRDRVFRGANIPRTSSEFMDLFVSIEPHAGREI